MRAVAGKDIEHHGENGRIPDAGRGKSSRLFHPRCRHAYGSVYLTWIKSLKKKEPFKDNVIKMFRQLRLKILNSGNL